MDCLLKKKMVSDHEKTDKYQGSEPAFLEIPPDNHSICSHFLLGGTTFSPKF